MKILITFFLLLSIQTSFADMSGGDMSELILFKSDGCTKWPDGTSENPYLWRDCCFTHDLHYWLGGTAQDRLDADVGLKQCVESTGQDTQAIMIYVGVRVGGSPNSDTSYRFGFGWPETRGYVELTEEDKKYAAHQLHLSTFTEHEKVLVEKFIEESTLNLYY